MTISKGTMFGKRKDQNPDDSWNYELSRYEKIFLQEVGHHAPTIEQLNSAGWMKRVVVEYDQTTHKLIADSWSDEGAEIQQNIIALTANELEALAIENNRVNEIKIRHEGSQALLDLTKPYSEEERGTWSTQESEARLYLIDNNAPCVMIRRIAFHRGISVAELVIKIMDNVELFQYVAGDILGVQQKKVDDLEVS